MPCLCKTELKVPVLAFVIHAIRPTNMVFLMPVVVSKLTSYARLQLVDAFIIP